MLQFVYCGLWVGYSDFGTSENVPKFSKLNETMLANEPGQRCRFEENPFSICHSARHPIVPICRLPSKVFRRVSQMRHDSA